jgi:3-hydroxyacyl-[acyl-carrier-protein] dehydratase
MPPQFLFDLSTIDLNRVLFDREKIRLVNPQRGAMEHLDAIVHVNESTEEIIGYKDVRDDEFWVDGHIPGRPLLPGVIMIECGAQLSSFYTRTVLKWTGFIGFGGVEECKFRLQVVPGQRLYLLGKQIWVRHRRMASKVQGIVDGALAFEATIIGAQL